MSYEVIDSNLGGSHVMGKCTRFPDKELEEVLEIERPTCPLVAPFLHELRLLDEQQASIDAELDDMRLEICIANYKSVFEKLHRIKTGTNKALDNTIEILYEHGFVERGSLDNPESGSDDLDFAEDSESFERLEKLLTRYGKMKNHLATWGDSKQRVLKTIDELNRRFSGIT